MIISLSGGLDSATLLYYALHELENEPIQPIVFLYGQKHKKETEFSKILCAQARIKFGDRVKVPLRIEVPLTSYGALTDPNQEVPPLGEVVGHPQPATYVPFRNLVFSSLALHYAEALNHHMVGLGVHKSDMYGYWDTSLDFITYLDHITRLNRKFAVRMWCPFLNMTKAAIVQRGLEFKVPYHFTWSCYKGQERPCRSCATCREREAAFEANNTIDPLLEKDALPSA